MSTPVTGHPAYPYPNVSTSSNPSFSTPTNNCPNPNIAPSMYPGPSAPPLPPASSPPVPYSINPYVADPSNQPLQGYHAPSSGHTTDSVVKSIGDTTRSVTHKFGNIVKHMTSGKSIPETALGKLHNISLIIPGEAEKIWRKKFQIPSTDQLLSHFACFLSTSAGAIPGILYVSYQNVGFYSDSPVSTSTSPDVRVQSHYKVLIPIQRVSQILSTCNPQKPEDRYIRVITVDNHEFWFLGFISFSEALKTLKTAQGSNTNMRSI